MKLFNWLRISCRRKTIFEDAGIGFYIQIGFGAYICSVKFGIPSVKFRAPEVSISIIQSFCLARNTAVMFSLVLLPVTWIHQLYLLLSILWIIADVWPTFALEILLWKMLIWACWMGACRFSWAICMSFDYMIFISPFLDVVRTTIPTFSFPLSLPEKSFTYALLYFVLWSKML